MPFFKKRSKPQAAITAPPRKINRKRTERLSLGLTPEEKDLINTIAKEAGVSRTDLIINSVQGKHIIMISGLPEVLLELSRQGNNLNQIARRLNERSYVNYEHIEEACRACQRAYENLVQFVDNWNIKLKKMEEKENADSESESIEREGA